MRKEYINGVKYYISADNCYVGSTEAEVEIYSMRTSLLDPTCGVLINGKMWYVFVCKTKQMYFDAIRYFCAYVERTLDNIIATQDKYDRMETIYAMEMDDWGLNVLDYEEIVEALYEELDHPKSSLRKIVGEITKIECLQRGVKTWIRG